MLVREKPTEPLFGYTAGQKPGRTKQKLLVISWAFIVASNIMWRKQHD
jgi:hypothetical protein